MKRGIGIILGVLLALSANAQDDEIKLSLDKLFSLKVTSVSGTAMDMKKSPAAIYVITAKDFKTQGHRTIADALRAVPGFHVKQIDASRFSVTSRGMGGRFADKLLVLIDGRSVYTPLFSGVYWEIQDLPLEDIDRIEVIRGPGATLWGANAVNGVINIVTKNARETEGGYLKLGLGSQVDYETEYRYGWQASDNVFMKVWGKNFKRDDTELSSGVDGRDNWNAGHWGMKLDWYSTPRDTHSLQANYSKLRIGSNIGAWNHTGTGFVPEDSFGAGTPSQDVAVQGAHLGGAPGIYTIVSSNSDDIWETGNLMWTWNKSISATAGWALKTYYDYTDYRSELFSERRQTIDVDFRNWFNINESNSFIWGLSFRTSRDHVDNTIIAGMLPEDKRVNTYSGFIQNTTQLTDKLSVMYGTKIEHNDYTGVEIQPSLRLTYELTPDTIVWTSFSRAVRTPSRADHDLQALFRDSSAEADGLTILDGGLNPVGVIPDNSYIELNVIGNEDFESEELLAYELGVRTNFFNKALTIDAAVFYNEYNKTRNYTFISETPPTAQISNTNSAETYGFELSAKVQATDKLDFMFNYTWFKANFHGPLSDGQQDSENLLFAQMNYQLFKNLSWHTTAYYSDNIRDGGMDSFINLDTGLIWDYNKNWSFSVWGKNLLDPQHPESGGGFFTSESYQIPRSVFFEATYKF